jgi:hypothetical protein
MLLRSLILFLIISTNVFATIGEQIQEYSGEQVAGDQVTCNNPPTTLPLDPKVLEELWAPLKNKNNDLFQRLFKNLDALTKLNSAFEKNDPINIAKVFYALKIFADLGDITITEEDLKLILNILIDSYKVQLSPDIVALINQVDKINIKKNKKNETTSIEFMTIGEKDVSFKLPKMESATLKHGAKLTFYDNRYKSLKEVMTEFFEDPGTGTKSKNLMPTPIKDAALLHLNRDEIFTPSAEHLSAVKIEINGFSVVTEKTTEEDARKVKIDRLLLITELNTTNSAFVGGTTGSGYGFSVAVEMPL